MIPKKIHYCWFGHGPMSDLMERCVESWYRRCPDYRIVRWDESNFDIESHSFTASSYARREFASVSDYVRAYALYEHGGIYVDTDVELKESLDDFLHHEAFSGFEVPGFPFTAVWGAVAGHPWPLSMLNEYARERAVDEPTNTRLMADILVREFGIDASNDNYQEGAAGVAIYPSSRLCLDLPRNTATHYFSGSWMPTADRVPFKDAVHARYYRDMLLTSGAYHSDSEVLRDLLWALGRRRATSAVIGLIPFILSWLLQRGRARLMMGARSAGVSTRGRQ